MVDYCGCQLAGRLWQAASAYIKNEHPGACIHSLQYDGLVRLALWVRVRMWNIGRLSGYDIKIYVKLRKRMVDVHCVNEVKWRDQDFRMFGMEGRF